MCVYLCFSNKWRCYPINLKNKETKIGDRFSRRCFSVLVKIKLKLVCRRIYFRKQDINNKYMITLSMLVNILWYCKLVNSNNDQLLKVQLAYLSSKPNPNFDWMHTIPNLPIHCIHHCVLAHHILFQTVSFIHYIHDYRIWGERTPPREEGGGVQHGVNDFKIVSFQDYWF